MDVLSTPEEAFADVSGWPSPAHRLEVDAGDGPVEMAVVDEGGGRPVLLLHGEPSWGYLYREFLPPLVEAGHRVVVPDLVGFGRSQKPASQDDHTYARHVTWLTQALHDELDLTDVVLFCQDWGGLLGLRAVAAAPHRYAGVVVANTGLPTGEQRMSEAFTQWQEYSRRADPFPVGRIVQGATVTELPDEVVAAYDAPFPDESYKAGPKVMPSLVPTAPDDPEHDAQVAAWNVLEDFERPVLTAFSDQDPVTRGGDRVFRFRVPGAQGQPHRTIEGAGHFLQEDRPAACVEAILAIR